MSTQSKTDYKTNYIDSKLIKGRNNYVSFYGCYQHRGQMLNMIYKYKGQDIRRTKFNKNILFMTYTFQPKVIKCVPSLGFAGCSQIVSQCSKDKASLKHL